MLLFLLTHLVTYKRVLVSLWLFGRTMTANICYQQDSHGVAKIAQTSSTTEVFVMHSRTKHAISRTKMHSWWRFISTSAISHLQSSLVLLSGSLSMFSIKRGNLRSGPRLNPREYQLNLAVNCMRPDLIDDILCRAMDIGLPRILQRSLTARTLRSSLLFRKSEC
jgi:hypothetical protein